MKVKELSCFMDKYGDYDITIEKSDPYQLTSNTTVQIERADVGFDWTHNQVVLTPSVKLTTHPDELKARDKSLIADLMDKNTNIMCALNKISRLLYEETNNEVLRESISRIIKEV